MSATRQGAGGARSAAVVITCTAHVDNPHISTHVPGTVNVVGHVDCDGVMAEIDITNLYLRRDGTVVSSALPADCTSCASKSTNAGAYCPGWSANYQGVMYFVATFPPGFSPAFFSSSATSNTMLIGC